jgi:hypothetical protein
MKEEMGLVTLRMGRWKNRSRRIISGIVLGSIIFMLGVAGSKNSPSLPPTINPAVACKRPKTATPYFPSARARDLLGSRLANFNAQPAFEAVARSINGTDLEDSRWLPPVDAEEAMKEPRYLRLFLATTSAGSISPPA